MRQALKVRDSAGINMQLAYIYSRLPLSPIPLFKQLSTFPRHVLRYQCLSPSTQISVMHAKIWTNPSFSLAPESTRHPFLMY